MEQAYYRLLQDILRRYDRSTPTNIVNLRNNQIFVFGTDNKGSQRYGAAGIAAKRFGAKVGVVDGPTGMCYALPTLGFSIEDLSHAVTRFEQYVRSNMQYTYLVTAVGCGHAGFDVNQVANMFRGLIGLKNVMLPDAFLKVFRSECNEYFKQQDTSATEKSDASEKEVAPQDDIFLFYDEHLHEVIRYLLANNIGFNPDGGFVIADESGAVIGEAELGIKSEKVVFFPFNSQSERAFKNQGFTIWTPTEYLQSKIK